MVVVYRSVWLAGSTRAQPNSQNIAIRSVKTNTHPNVVITTQEIINFQPLLTGAVPVSLCSR